MNHSNQPYQLISYEEFPEDQYTMAVAEVMIDNAYTVAYAKKKNKEGNFFWGVASIGVTKNGVKKFYQSYIIESRSREKQIIEFIRNSTRSLSNGNGVAMNASITPTQGDSANEHVPF